MKPVDQMKTQILIVDDDRSQQKILSRVLKDRVDTVRTASSGEEALVMIETERPNLVLLDMRMPGIDGMGVLEEMKQRGISVPVIMVTAFAEVETAVQAIKLGAVDYLRKPLDLGSLDGILQKHLPSSEKTLISKKTRFELPDDVVFESPVMKQILTEVEAVADSDVPALIYGESGTGKEIIASLLHSWSPRSKSKHVPINVSALPSSLVESELFGYEKGAFTGAIKQHIGWFEQANGGTLFLDEIGDLPIEIQPKLLRAIETQKIHRLGGTKEISLDLRLISATNKDLETLIEQGLFRADLFYRTAVFTLEIPPLRERPEDILPLARMFLAKFASRPKTLTEATEKRLLSYRWPGNVRQIKNCIQRAAIIAPGDWILPEHLPNQLREDANQDNSSPEGGGLKALLEVEKETILDAVKRCKGNKSKAARELGISRRKLIYKMKEYDES